MAITSDGGFGTATSSGSGTTLALTPTGTISSGHVAVLVVVGDNLGTVDCDNSDVRTVADTASNKWTRLAEYSNTNGAAGGGCTVSIWKSKLTTQLTNASTVTVTFSAAVTNKCSSLWSFAVVNDLHLVAENRNQVDASNGYGSAAISGLSSKEYLFFRGLGKEANSATVLTVTANYTAIGENTSTGVLVRGEFRIVTGTGETSNPTMAVSGDTAGILLALEDANVVTATPKIVQRIGTTASAGDPSQTWNKRLPNPSQAGNCLVVAVFAGSASAAPSVSDDKSNVWYSTQGIPDGAHGTSLFIFYAPNCAASTQLITVDFGGSFSYGECYWFELTNIAAVAPLDGQGGQVTSGTAITTGNFATSLDGDFILQICAADSWSAQSTTMTWTAGSGMTMSLANSDCYMAAQHQVQGSASSATNPSQTSSLSFTSVVTKAVAFKAESKGADLGAGVKVLGVSTQSLENGGVYATYSGTTFGFDFPVNGDTIALGWTGQLASKLISVSSSPALTWASAAASADSGGSENSTWWWYALGATPGTKYRVTLTFPSTPGASIQNFVDISGADSFDTYAPASGTNNTIDTGGSGPVNGPLITPANVNSLILTVGQEDRHTITNVSPGTCLSVNILIYAHSAGETDQGLALYYAPTTDPVQIVWTYSGYEDGGVGPGAYCSESISFAPAAGEEVAASTRRLPFGQAMM